MANKQFAIIGISKFGQRMIEELSALGCELLVIDKKKEVIELLKDKVSSAYVADVINEETIRKIVPETIDGVVIDLGDSFEVSILVTNYVKKMGIKTIMAKAETDEHGEILKIVGATHVIFPNREAAKRIAPIITSSQVFQFLPISESLVIAEVEVTPKYYGKTLIEADFRRTCSLNIIAIKSKDSDDYSFFTPEYKLLPKDQLLVAGSVDAISKFSGVVLAQKKNTFTEMIKRLWTR